MAQKRHDNEQILINSKPHPKIEGLDKKPATPPAPVVRQLPHAVYDARGDPMLGFRGAPPALAASSGASDPAPPCGRRGGPGRTDISRGRAVRAYRYEMRGFIDQCIARYLEVAHCSENNLRKVVTPGIDDSAFSQEYFQCPGLLAPSAASVLM